MADSDREDRPSPDALLAEAQRETRGRLKIFLGAAPGVGKTYAMLEAAHERQRDGVDIAIGVVETHGRQETERLVANLPLVPPKTVEYRGRVFNEMDLDAILARHPKIVLVDELAHSNVPGSRHVKRYEDVEEILDAGIDVYSTLNIQHLESLNDVIERIAGIKVRETLPDSVLGTAAEIELIDLPPDDLLKRLADGKVYLPEQAKRAAQHFFSPGTLTALREMALRHAAERVDAQMLTYMRAHAIAGPWPARERILVCVGHDMGSMRMIRVAKRVAERRNAPWVAVYVETHRHLSLSEDEKDRIDRTLRLAQQLGGDTVTLQGEDVAGEVLAYARENNCTQLVVGRSRRRGIRRLFADSITAKLLAQSSAFDIMLVGGDEADGPPPALKTKKPAEQIHWGAYVLATLGVAAATGIGFVINIWLSLPNISVGFLIAVMFIAMKLGSRAGDLRLGGEFSVVQFLFCRAPLFPGTRRSAVHPDDLLFPGRCHHRLEPRQPCAGPGRCRQTVGAAHVEPVRVFAQDRGGGDAR